MRYDADLFGLLSAIFYLVSMIGFLLDNRFNKKYCLGIGALTSLIVAIILKILEIAVGR